MAGRDSRMMHLHKLRRSHRLYVSVPANDFSCRRPNGRVDRRQHCARPLAQFETHGSRARHRPNDRGILRVRSTSIPNWMPFYLTRIPNGRKSKLSHVHFHLHAVILKNDGVTVCDLRRSRFRDLRRDHCDPRTGHDDVDVNLTPFHDRKSTHARGRLIRFRFRLRRV